MSIPYTSAIVRDQARTRRMQLFLRRGWPAVIALIILGLVVGFLLSLFRPEVYTARATLFVSVESPTSATDLNQGASYIESQMTSFAELAKTRAVLEPVADALGPDRTVGFLRQAVEVTNPAGTVVLDIAAEDSSPEQATLIANETAQYLSSAIAEASPATDQQDVSINARIVDEAASAAGDGEEYTQRSLLLGGAAGALAGVLLLLLLSMLDRRIRGEADVSSIIPHPVVMDAGRRSWNGAARSEGDDLGILAHQLLAPEGAPSTWTVVASDPDSDSMQAALSLAKAFSEMRRGIIVLDATAQTAPETPAHPDVAPSSRALTKAITDRSHVAQPEGPDLQSSADRSSASSSLAVSPTGPTVITVEEMAQLGWDLRRQDHAYEALHLLAQHADEVIAATGPLGRSPWTAVLVPQVDAVVIAVRRDRTSLRSFGQAADVLRSSNHRVVATILQA